MRKVKKQKKYIVSDPQIMGGQLVIAGTRIPVAVLIALLKEGYTTEAIQEEYSWVPLEKIEGAISELVEILSESDNAKKIL